MAPRKESSVPSNFDRGAAPIEESRLEMHRRFQALSFREKLEAIEKMSEGTDWCDMQRQAKLNAAKGPAALPPDPADGDTSPSC